MKNEAQRARKDRLAAAKRLIKHEHHTPAEDISPAPPPRDIVRRMVRPVEVQVKVVTA